MHCVQIVTHGNKTCLMSTCPNCGSTQMCTNMLVCNYCYEAMHNALDLFNDVRARVNCYEDKDPWEYENANNV